MSPRVLAAFGGPLFPLLVIATAVSPVLAGVSPLRSYSRLAEGASAQASGDEPVAALVRVPFPQDDGTLTPYTFRLAYPLVTLVYDTLMWRDDQGIPQPWLATSVEPGPDPRRITVRLDPQARWHDGVELTAADVVFSFELFKKRPHERFTPQLAAVEKLEEAEPSTVVITLRHASPGFLDQPLADVPILPAHVWRSLPSDKVAPDGLPVGSGPYRLVEHRPGELYRFEANTGYFRGPPQVQTIVVPVIPRFDETLRALERGRVDLVPLTLGGAAAAQAKGGATRVKSGPSYGGTVVMFNLRAPPFDQPQARLAVAGALDTARITAAVGAATVADRGYLHPASRWAPSEPVSTPGGTASKPSLAGALPPFELLVADNDVPKLAAAHQVVQALDRAGAKAVLKPLPARELSKAVGEDGSPPSFTAAIWTAPSLASYDPDFLRAVFGSDPRQGVLNYSGYRSDAFDAIAQRVAASADPLVRRQAVEEEMRLLAADVPVVPLFFSTGTFAYRPGAYDRWAFVKGTGMLDKRSFVSPPAQPGGLAAPAARAVDNSGLSAVGWAALVILGAWLVVGVAWLVVRAVRR